MPIPIAAGITAVRELPWKLIGFAALGMALVLLYAALQVEKRHSAKLQAQVEKCTDARKADRTAYETAQKQAADLNRAEVAKIEAAQDAKTQRVRNDYAKDLAAVRAEFDRRLRAKAAAAAQGAANSPGQPGVPDTPGGVDDPAAVCVPAGDILLGAEVELRLLHLQSWVREQLAIPR